MGIRHRTLGFLECRRVAAVLGDDFHSRVYALPALVLAQRHSVVEADPLASIHSLTDQLDYRPLVKVPS